MLTTREGGWHAFAWSMICMYSGTHVILKASILMYYDHFGCQVSQPHINQSGFVFLPVRKTWLFYFIYFVTSLESDTPLNVLLGTLSLAVYWFGTAPPTQTQRSSYPWEMSHCSTHSVPRWNALQDTHWLGPGPQQPPSQSGWQTCPSFSEITQKTEKTGHDALLSLE